jgi:hypothetical protein
MNFPRREDVLMDYDETDFSCEQKLAIEEHICYHKFFIDYLESTKKGECVKNE